jgi:hypothetical protein
MVEVLRYAGQAIFYGACAAAIGYLSNQPVYRQVPEGQAQIKLAFNHGGARVEDCRKIAPEELAKLPSNQRKAGSCSRQRLPVMIELLLDGRPIYGAVLQPTGLSSDMPSETYKKFLVPAGHHVIEARLRDSKRTEGFDYDGRFETDLGPWQNLAIDFKAEQGGFLFR